MGGLSGEYIEPDAKDPTANIIYFKQAGISLPEREYYLSKEARYADIRAQVRRHAHEVLRAWSAGRSRAADAKAVLALETEMATIRWTPAESRDAIKTYNKMALAKFDTDFAGFDWTAWARAQGFDKLPDVIVAQPSFFKGIGALSKKVPLETWKAWLTAKVLTADARFLSKAFVDTNFEFFGKTLIGQQAQRPRWKRGVALVNGSLLRGGREDVRREALPGRVEGADAEDWSPTCSRPTRQSITNLDWMTPETKKEALAKLAKFTTKIGYPDEVPELRRARDQDRRPRRQRRARDEVRRRLPAVEAREARRPDALAHAAAGGQRLLQPGPERDRLSRGDPPAAVLRSDSR